MFNPNKFERFIPPQASCLSQNILNEPEEIVELDLNDFKEGESDNEEGRKIQVYIHQTLLTLKENNKMDRTLNYGGLENILNECFLLHHVDMYFNFLYRYIINVEFERQGQVYSADLESVFNKYIKLSDFILDSTVKVKNPNIIVSDQEKSLFRSAYNQPLDQANSYKEMLSYYIVARNNVTEQFRKETNELNFFVPLFAQIAMLEGFKIATERIKNMLNTKAYFGHEIIATGNSSVLKLFMSPYGALMKDQLVEKAKKKLLDREIDEYLEEFKILRVTDENKVKELKTKYIFHAQQDNQIFYFKKRGNEEREKEPSFEQDPTNPLRALIVQSQLNLIGQV